MFSTHLKITVEAVEKRNWIALSLSLLAGLATAVGGLVVYFKKLVKLANKTFLSAALGFSSGVMLFLSFAEIYIEAKETFNESLNNEQLATLYACLSLFAGVAIAFLLEFILHKGSDVEFELPVESEQQIDKEVYGDKKVSGHVVSGKEKGQLVEGELVHNPIMSGAKSLSPVSEPLTVEVQKSGYEVKTITGDTSDLTKENYFVESGMKELKTVGLMSAIAITLHNIPEGIVTYIGYVANPVVGITLAVGIAAHNIPEGLSVALPVFYATNNRGKAFLWSLISGLAEPFGAFLCMLVLSKYVNNYINGFLFGFTGGIMTHICVFELLPTGLKLDCKRNYTSAAFLFGVGFIMTSLVLLLCCVC